MSERHPPADITIITEHRQRVDKDRTKALVHAVCATLKLRGSIGILFTNNAGIRTYNRQFRNKNKATDVLSFTGGTDGHIGDIVISCEWVRNAYAPAKRRAMTDELIIHGLLHVSGEHHTYSTASLAKNRARMDIIKKSIETVIRLR
ncbi:MAG: rRNA maturation RNase YbeY [Spirochaetes bacterium]|nr:rRNA maturation RNase YbeY [Spirochaetota bacterium]